MIEIISEIVKPKWPVIINGVLVEGENKLSETCNGDCIKPYGSDKSADSVMFCRHNLSFHTESIDGTSITICCMDIDGASGKSKFFQTKEKYKKRRAKKEDPEVFLQP